MSIQISKGLRCLGVALAASAWLCGSFPSLIAGEAIQFSPSKSKAEPGVPNSKLPKEKLSTFDLIPSSNPFDPANLARSGDNTRRPKTKEDRRRELAELEKKNWAAVEPGQLQEEEDEKTSMGVRDYDVENGGKGKNSSGVWLDRRNGNPRSRGAPARGPGQNRPQPVRETDDAGSSLKIGNVGGQTGEQSLSGPGSGEPKLNNLLGPDPAPGGLSDTFSGGNSSGDPGRRGDSGLRTIETPTGTRPTSLGGRDSPGLGRDLSSRPALSAAPSLLDTPRSQPPSSFAPLGSGPGFGPSRDRNSSPFNDATLAPRGFGNSASPLTQQRNQFSPGSSRDAFAPPARPSSGR